MATTLRVTDMSCEGCEDIVVDALEEVAGVESATADHEANVAEVEGDAEVTDLVDAVDYAGYNAEAVPDDASQTEETDDAASADEN